LTRFEIVYIIQNVDTENISGQIAQPLLGTGKLEKKMIVYVYGGMTPGQCAEYAPFDHADDPLCIKTTEACEYMHPVKIVGAPADLDLCGNEVADVAIAVERGIECEVIEADENPEFAYGSREPKYLIPEIKKSRGF
jgi:hypothetical protein